MNLWRLIAVISALIFTVVIPLIILGRQRATCLLLGHKARVSIGRASARSGLFICQRCDSLFSGRA